MALDLDLLPALTPRQAYLAMYEFLAVELELNAGDPVINLGGLLAEMEPEADGSTSDPGAGETFAEAVQKVLAPGYQSRWDATT